MISIKNTTFTILAFSTLIHIISSYFNVGFYNMDEHFQILGPVEYLLGLNNNLFQELWEFTESGRIRPWLQSYLYFYIIKLLVFIGINDPFSWTFALRLTSSLIGLYSTYIFYNLIKDDYNINNIFSKILILLFWFSPFIHSRTSSENLGFSFFLIGLFFVLKIYKNTGNLYINSLLSGIFLGLSILTKYHFLFITLFILIHFFAINFEIKKIKYSLVTLIIVSIVFILGIIIDSIAYGSFNLTILNYFRINNDHAFNSFGHEPFWYYFIEILTKFSFPLSIFIILFTLIFWIRKPKDILSFITLPYFILLSYLGHKELRFIFPVLEFSPFFISYVVSNFNLFKRFYISKIILIFNFIYIGFIFIPLTNEIKIYEKIYNYNGNLNIIYFDHNPYIIKDLEPKLYTSFLENLNKYDKDLHENNFLIIFKNIDNYKWFVKKNKCEHFYSVYPISLIELFKETFKHLPKWYIAKCNY